MSKKSFQFTEIGELSQVKRVHQAVAIGLAVFMLTLVLLREPFRGYLAEVHISGPSTAGLDLDDAVGWLKKAEPHLAAVAVPAGEVSAKCEIRATFVGAHPKPALLHLDDLADRWLYQYLPDRLQTYRHGVLGKLRAAVSQARQREDSKQERLEELRQQQVAALGKGQEAEEGGTRIVAAAGGQIKKENQKTVETLQALRAELSQLLASHTEEHPAIVTLKSRISALEHELGIPAASGAQRNGEVTPAIGERQVNTATEYAAIKQTGGELADGSVARLGMEIASAASELAEASRARQAAEQHLTERMQELSGEPTAAQWSAAPAHIVTRIGGTPRVLTLVMASVLAAVAGIVMFRATAVELIPKKIESAEELTTALELPVVEIRSEEARLKSQNRGWRGLITPTRLRVATYCAECFVAVAAGACLVSVAVDPSLAREVLADPFGTLSEVMGRFGA